MINADALDALVGWSTGYSFAISKTKEDEIKQGKNYVMASIFQVSLVGNLCTAVSRLADNIPQTALKTTVKAISNVTPFLALPFCLFAACVKQNLYKDVAKFWNSRNYLSGKLNIPTKLRPITTKVMSFFSEHLGDMVRVAIVVSGIALVAIGNTFFGGALLVAVTYECIDRMGLVPRKISLFMETYMPSITNFGILIGGTILNQIIAVIVMPSFLFPSYSQFIHRGIDQFIHNRKWVSGPTLNEIDAPLKQNKQLTFDQINEVLNDYDFKYEVNPAHTSKWLFEEVKLPKSENFNRILTLFNKVEWKEKYTLIMLKLKDDERFIDNLRKEFVELNGKEITKEIFKEYFKKLAEKNKLSPQAYAVKYIENEMEILVNVLSGNKRIKSGTQQDLDDAINMCKMIIPYLENLQNDIEKGDTSQRVEFEDALLKLAVEGGSYCSRGIKRASNELLGDVYRKVRPDESTDPVDQFENKIQASLQNKRYMIVQEMFQLILNKFYVPGGIGTDVHAFDIYRTYLSLGFYPLSRYERFAIGIAEIGIWEFYGKIRNEMYAGYRNSLEDSVKEIGYVHLADYVRKQIESNPNLTAKQKVTLNERWYDSSMTTDQINRNYSRLMFVMLGVLRKKV